MPIKLFIKNLRSSLRNIVKYYSINDGNIPKSCYAIRSYDNNWYNYLYLYFVKKPKTI